MLTCNNPDRKALVKLRISNSKLKIETGRYDGEISKDDGEISKDERLYSVCELNNIENEIHFLFYCHNYS